MLTIQLQKKFENIENIWAGLLKNKNATIYQSPEYVKMICKNFFPYKFILRETIEFYVFFENEKPIMILPLFKKWFKNSYVLFGYKAGCGYLDAIYSNAMDIKKMGECFAALKEQFSISEIEMYYVKESSVLGEYISKTKQEVIKTNCTTIFLPNAFDEYQASLSKNVRQNIRTAYNRLNKKEKKYSLEIFNSAELTKNLREQLLGLYIERQMKHYKKGGGLFFKLFVKFVDVGTKIPNEIPNKTKTFLLKIDGKVAAYFDAIYDKDEQTITIPRLAIDEMFSWFSPGIILLNESIKKLLKEGTVKKIDLTHGDERYKLAMGGVVSACLKTVLKIGN